MNKRLHNLNFATFAFAILFIAGGLSTGCTKKVATTQAAEDLDPTPTPEPTPEPTPTPTPTPSQVYLKGTLFPASGDETFLAGATLELSQTVATSGVYVNKNKLVSLSTEDSATTGNFGEYELEVPYGAGTYSVAVSSSTGSSLGSFNIKVLENGQLDPTHAISYSTGSTFSSTIPATKVESEPLPVYSGPYSDLTGVTDAGQKAILEVIHQKSFEPLWKNASGKSTRLGVTTTNHRLDTLTGSGGGSVSHRIIYSNAFGGSGSPWVAVGSTAIANEKMHLFTFNNFTENGITVNGTYGFIYGYKQHTLSPAGYPPETDDNWINDPEDVTTQFENILGDPVNSYADGTIFGYFNFASLATHKANLLPLSENALKPNNKLTISGSVSTTVKVNFSINNMFDKSTTEDRTAIYSRDELQLQYVFAAGTGVSSGTQSLIEYTPQGKFKRTFNHAFATMIGVDGVATDNQLYQITGSGGGSVTRSKVYAAQSDGNYSVIEKWIFDNYQTDEGVALHGELNYKYQTAGRYGVINGGGQFTSSIHMTGYYHGAARFSIDIYHDPGSGVQFSGDGDYNISMIGYLEDSSEVVTQRAIIIIPVSISL